MLVLAEQVRVPAAERPAVVASGLEFVALGLGLEELVRPAFQASIGAVAHPAAQAFRAEAFPVGQGAR